MLTFSPPEPSLLRAVPTAAMVFPYIMVLTSGIRRLGWSSSTGRKTNPQERDFPKSPTADKSMRRWEAYLKDDKYAHMRRNIRNKKEMRRTHHCDGKAGPSDRYSGGSGGASNY
jgi:hypothetical protein